ncbi:unnamed protein product [Zymoseptoria tritici ST99CH_1E4]|uniref:Uncharacterized protein n=1 Tax=Zymoseptoria tritici ST99CH_1E4 TaxID=1276532 RepID=A0A2H1H9K6_ZYMTR|nr:unnamed protein product [Zymoseptoria tritici ST99CH_1E4]
MSPSRPSTPFSFFTTRRDHTTTTTTTTTSSDSRWDLIDDSDDSEQCRRPDIFSLQQHILQHLIRHARWHVLSHILVVFILAHSPRTLRAGSPAERYTAVFSTGNDTTAVTTIIKSLDRVETMTSAGMDAACDLSLAVLIGVGML